MDMEAIAERLRRFRVRTTAESSSQVGPQTNPSAVPSEAAFRNAEQAPDPLQQTIDRFLQNTYEIGEISPRFKSLGDLNFTADLRLVKYDFKDNELMSQAGITMKRAIPEEIVALGRRVIPMVSSGFTGQGAAAVFTLAYNLIEPDSNYSRYIFDGVEELETISDRKYTDYSERVMFARGTLEPLSPLEDIKKEAAVYSYIAASMLRLVTKPPANYVRAWNHIVDGFAQFYQNRMNMNLPTPREDAMKGLASKMSTDPKAKIALYRLLWLGNSNQNHMGLKRYLYEMHLENTGMHLAGMFVDLCKILKCSHDVLLPAISCRGNSRQVKCLTHLLELLEDTSKDHAKNMWKYGRIFDETFMADIQTRACPKLVYVFAEALRAEDPRRYAGVLQIAQLADVSETDKRKSVETAQRLVSYIHNKVSTSGVGGE